PSTPYGGALLNAGLQIPLVSGNNENFQLKAFADGFLALGYLPYPSLFSRWKWAVPGFAGGLRFTWLENTPGELGMGFELKYRGFLFADNRYLHSIGAGIVAAW
ncbi:MAG: hypothetical protein LBG84_11805, partial [Treponema sp.]|nr:hypothetical protein [Treponema sp.]